MTHYDVKESPLGDVTRNSISAIGYAVASAAAAAGCSLS